MDTTINGNIRVELRNKPAVVPSEASVIIKEDMALRGAKAAIKWPIVKNKAHNLTAMMKDHPSKNETDLEALMEAIAGGDATAMLEDELEEDRDEPLLAPTWVLKPCRYSERAPFLLHCSAKKSSSAQQQV